MKANPRDHLTENEAQAVRQFARVLKSVLGDNLISIILFGSKVRGDFSGESDIDLLILLKERMIDDEWRIACEWTEVELAYDAGISYVVFSQDQIEKNKRIGSPFTENIEREGVAL